MAMNFFQRMNAQIQQFMSNRNGADTLAVWALGGALVFMVINLFIPNAICSMLSFALMLYAVYRMFSSKVAYRREENERFEGFISRFGAKGRSGSGRSSNSGSTGSPSSKQSEQSKPDTIVFACERCGQKLTVPKGRGKLKVTCPKCNKQQMIDS